MAELRGITRKAAIRLTQRHRWRRQPGNDGAARVFVPADITRRQTPRDDVGPAPPPDAGFHAKALAALETALSALREAHGAEVAGLRERLNAAEERANLADARAQEAQEAAEVLRQAATRRAKGRLRRAWDGWRGR